MTRKYEKDELNNITKNARDNLYNIESTERRRENESRLGKCFKYRNSQQDASDYWWLYARVDGISESGEAITFQFQIDKYGDGSVESKKYSMGNEWTQISEEEFVREWDRVKRTLSAKFGE